MSSKVFELLTRLQQKGKFNISSRKDALEKFHKYYGDDDPRLDSDSIYLLLAGDGGKKYKIGLLQYCGTQEREFEKESKDNGDDSGFDDIDSVPTVKRSVLAALYLLVSLIRLPMNKTHAMEFHKVLPQIPIDIYRDARLEKLILRKSTKLFAALIVNEITSKTKITVNELLGDSPGFHTFRSWLLEKNKDEKTHHSATDDTTSDWESKDDDQQKQITKWAEVPPEEFEVQQGHGAFSNLNDQLSKLALDDISRPVVDPLEQAIGIHNTRVAHGSVAMKNLAGDDLAFEDPLGLVAPENVEQAMDRFRQNKKEIEELRRIAQQTTTLQTDTYYEQSPNLLSEKFDPATFLVEVHSRTRFEDLNTGKKQIQSIVKQQSTQMQALVKEHFSQFVRCKETIDDIHVMLGQTVDAGTKKMISDTNTMLTDLQGTNSMASQLVTPMLDRTKEARAVGDTLTLIRLPTFRFFFNLPQQIKHNVEMGTFDQVVRLWKQARNTHQSLQSNVIIREIMGQVTKQIVALREQLFKQLRESQVFTEEDEHIIRYLSELEINDSSSDDPAMYLLNQRYKRISELLSECVTEHQTRVKALSSKDVFTAGEDDDDTMTQVEHSQKKMVKKMCKIFNHFMPSFWKFGKKIIDGKFARDDAHRLQVDPTTENKSARRHNYRKVKELFEKLTTQFSKQVRESFEQISPSSIEIGIQPTSLYGNNVVNGDSVLSDGDNPKDKSDELRRLSETVKDNVRNLLTSYRAMKAVRVPADYLYQVDDLMSSVCRNYLTKLFTLTLQSVLQLATKEKWRPHREIPGITTVPLTFQTLVTKTIGIIDEIGIEVLYDADEIHQRNMNKAEDSTMPMGIHSGLGDDWDRPPTPSHEKHKQNPAFDRFNQAYMNAADEKQSTDDDDFQWVDNAIDDMSPPLSESGANIDYQLNAVWMVPLIASFFMESQKLFADVLHQLVFLTDGTQPISLEKNVKFQPRVRVLDTELESSDRRLLAVLSNAIYTKSHVLEKLWHRLMRNGRVIGIEYQNIVENERQSITDLYTTLEQMIFDRYVRCKTLKLNRVIDNAMLCDGINWEMASEPRQIRNHCLELLLQIVFIHNEVYNSAKQELTAVLSSLLEKITDHLLDTIKAIDRFSPMGATQVIIEIEFIRETLKKYLTELSQDAFAQINSFLQQYTAQDDVSAMEKNRRLISQTQRSTVVMFSCFREPVDDAVVHSIDESSAYS